MLEIHRKHQGKKNAITVRIILLACCFIISFSVIADNDAEELITETFELSQSENVNYFSPKEPLVVVIPKSFNQGKMKNVTIELDSVDISEMVQIANSEMVYSPLQAMFAESHELRITEYTEDGDINELGVTRHCVQQERMRVGSTSEARESSVLRVWNICGKILANA